MGQDPLARVRRREVGSAGKAFEAAGIRSKDVNHKESILEAFRANGGRLTLGEILKHPWGYEARARFTELRHEGHTINLIKEDHKVRSNNLYELVEKNSGVGGEIGITPGRNPAVLGSSPSQHTIFYEGKQSVMNLGI
jgi:hypothetical protein